MPIFDKVSLPIYRFVRYAHKSSKTIKVGVLDVPFEKGQKKTGVSRGPKVLRDAELIAHLNQIHNVKVKDYGELVYSRPTSKPTKISNMNHYDHVVSCNKNLAATVEKIIAEGQICLTLGGDHSIGLGTVAGHCKAKKNVALLWVDAHPDINTINTSDSGNMHGMPVAILAKQLAKFWKKLPGMDWHKPSLSLTNVAYIGIRSIDPYEEWILNNFGVATYDMSHIQNHGIEYVVSRALAKIDPNKDMSLHLSFDIDALDPSEAPSTGTPVRGGLMLREGIHIANFIHNTGRLGAMDLVEVNPSLGTKDDVNRTVQAAVHVIMAAFGYNRRGVQPGLPPLKPV